MLVENHCNLIEVELKEDDDRVLCFQVTDKHGNRYSISAEFLAQQEGLGFDEVQLSLCKIPKGVKETPYSPIHPNRILFGPLEATVWKKDLKKEGLGQRSGTACGSFWYEFHQIGDLPAV